METHLLGITALDDFTQGKYTVASFPKCFTQKFRKIASLNNLRQNTVCLEQKISPSPDNFTPKLLVTFIMSAINLTNSNSELPY